MRITKDGGWKVDPDYATSVKVADKSPLTIQVKLNPKAVWQGGTPITSKDMVAFWKAQNGKDNDFEVSSTQGYEDISDVKPGDDPYSYDVVFNEPTAEWPLYIYPRLPANVSASAKAVQRRIHQEGAVLQRSVHGDVDRRHDGHGHREAQPALVGHKPKLSSIVWRIAAPDVQAAAYTADELDAINVDATTYSIARKHGTIQQAAGTEWTQVTLNGARGPLKDANVRRAVAHAIDRTKIADAASREFGLDGVTLGSLVYVPGQRGYADSRPLSRSTRRSEATARQGRLHRGKDGILVRKGKQLKLTMPVPTETPANSQRAKAIKRDLRRSASRSTSRTCRRPTSSPTRGLRSTSTSSRSPGEVRRSRSPLPSPCSTRSTRARTSPVWPMASSTTPSTSLTTLDDSQRFKRVARLDARIFAKPAMVPLAVTPIVMAVRDDLRNYGAAQFEQPDWTIVGLLKKTD